MIVFNHTSVAKPSILHWRCPLLGVLVKRGFTVFQPIISYIHCERLKQNSTIYNNKHNVIHTVEAKTL